MEDELRSRRESGLHRRLRRVTGRGVRLRIGERELLSFASNDYLDLAHDPRLAQAAARAAKKFGTGAGASPLICGYRTPQRKLERELAEWLHCESSLVFSSGFAANLAVIAALAGREDAIFSDELNHASVIDGIRLSKAKRFRYKHNDMADLERCLREAAEAGLRFKLVFTDGVFSMDGTIAQLDRIRDLCDRYDALLGIDDCHATGILGAKGRGTHELRGVLGKVDLITGTLGKALGGASGGFTSGRKEVIELLRQRSRPYLFSNSVAPPIVGASIAVLDLLESSTELRDKLESNTQYFRKSIAAAGFDIKPGEHPIVPIMVYDAEKASLFAARLLELGVYVVGFFYPVVPKGQARIRVQISAGHSLAQLEGAVAAFSRAGREVGVLK